MLNATIIALLIINSTVTGIGNTTHNITNCDDTNLSGNLTGPLTSNIDVTVNGSFDDMPQVLPNDYHMTLKTPL